jgi:hypothetical protein
MLTYREWMQAVIELQELLKPEAAQNASDARREISEE